MATIRAKDDEEGNPFARRRLPYGRFLTTVHTA